MVRFFRMTGLSNYFDVICGREDTCVNEHEKPRVAPRLLIQEKIVMVLCAEITECSLWEWVGGGGGK